MTALPPAKSITFRFEFEPKLDLAQLYDEFITNSSVPSIQFKHIGNKDTCNDQPQDPMDTTLLAICKCIQIERNYVDFQVKDKHYQSVRFYSTSAILLNCVDLDQAHRLMNQIQENSPNQKFKISNQKELLVVHQYSLLTHISSEQIVDHFGQLPMFSYRSTNRVIHLQFNKVKFTVQKQKIIQTSPNFEEAATAFQALQEQLAHLG